MFVRLLAVGFFSLSLPWSNGPAGNATTNTAAECSNPPYATHDWIADHALALLPAAEEDWLRSRQAMYLLGTEAPDNSNIPAACGAPNTGYDDRRYSHSVNWNSAHTWLYDTRAILRAQEEYDKAVDAVAAGQFDDAAFYLGAMAHYIGDLAQYGHTYPGEQHHSDYENWAKSRTDRFDDGVFESYINPDGLQVRRAHEAGATVSRAASQGIGDILSAAQMDAHYGNRDQQYLDSVGAVLNLVVNELADVLHKFAVENPVP